MLGCVSYLIAGKLRIFVDYENSAEGFQAFIHLNERYYAGRLISVRFYGSDEFRIGNYGRDLHEHISF